MASITSFSPSSATPAQLVTINGSGFTGATAVKFGAVDALFFRVVSDILIEAYPNLSGTNIITVTTLTGDVSASGFTLLLTKVRLVDLPLLNRVVGPNDLQYVWDIIRNKLCQAPNSAFPAGTGTGGGGGDTGNVFTALGSPFKVRIGDDIYSYDSDLNAVTVTDLRLLGKQDYIVSASDISNEFENYNTPASADTTTTATDGTYLGVNAVTITGGGSGAVFNVKTLNNTVVLIIQTTLGTGYTAGDTFSIDELPGIIFTLNSVDGGIGALVYDMVIGSVTILNYQLTGNRHISIHADGVVNTQLQDAITAMQADNVKLKKVAAPFLPSLNGSGIMTNPGGLVAWFRPANEIPDGWAEWLPGRGCDLRGQDPTDTYDPTSNPDGLSQANTTQGGSKQLPVLVEANIPKIQLHLFSGSPPAGNLSPTGGTSTVAWSSAHLSGNQDYDMKKASDSNASQGLTSAFGSATPTQVNKPLDPFRIVNFIYSTQTV